MSVMQVFKWELIAAIDDVLYYVDDEAFMKCLQDCKNKHIKMQEEKQALLVAQDEKA